MVDIFRNAAEFCNETGFNDDVTILVVKCDFDGSEPLTLSPVQQEELIKARES
jgi:hypothetical protein